jgi:two-component system NtrC family sensor kinase
MGDTGVIGRLRAPGPGPVGLRARLLVLLLVPMALAVGWYGFARVRSQEEAWLAEERVRIAALATAFQVAVEKALEVQGPTETQRFLDEVVRRQADVDRLRVFDADGLLLVTSTAPLSVPPGSADGPSPGDFARTAREPGPIVRSMPVGEGHVIQALVGLRVARGVPRGILELVRVDQHVATRVRAARLEVVQRLAWLAAGLAVILWFGVRQSVLVPIRRLRGAVRALEAGEPKPLPVRGHDELAELARAFNRMTERLTLARWELEAEAETRLDLARQLRETEQLVVAGRIASEVAHEVGTPLNVISGRAEHLVRLLGPDDPRVAHLRTIIDQAERIAKIFSSLLGVVRPRKPERQLVDLGALVRSVVDLLRPTTRAKGLRLEADAAPELRLTGDPTQLQQVIINLVMNAVEATPRGGRIVVVTQAAKGPEGRAGAEIRVVDTGAGIPSDTLARIFEPFFTTKPPGQGTGLGLPICRDIVRDHDGAIDVESQPGAGTTVRVWLPTTAGA